MNQLLNQIFRDYYKDVYRYLLSISHDADLSEELAAEVFLAVVVSFKSFRGEADVKTWLFAIARNKYFSHLRKRNTDIRTETLFEFFDGNTLQIPEEEAFINELYDKIKEFLSYEDEKTSEIVLMRSDGYSFYEIAKKYGITENSARVIFYRAKEKIKSKLKKEGYKYE